MKEEKQTDYSKYDDKKYNILYETRNIVNNHIYVGAHSTNNLDDGYLGSGKLLREAIKEFGKDKFVRSTIQFFDNIIDMFEAEKKYITKEFKNREDTYNITGGGNRPHNNILRGDTHFNKGRKWTEEQYKLMSKVLKGKCSGTNNPSYKGEVYMMCGKCPIAVFESTVKVQELTGIDRRSVSSCINKERETSKGFRFTRDVKKEQAHFEKVGFSKYELRDKPKKYRSNMIRYFNVIQYDPHTGEEVARYKNNIEASEVTGIDVHYINRVLSGSRGNGVTCGYMFSTTELDYGEIKNKKKYQKWHKRG